MGRLSRAVFQLAVRLDNGSHVLAASFGFRATAGAPCCKQQPRGNNAIHPISALKRREFPVFVIRALERGRVDGDEPADLVGEQLEVDLRDVSAEGLSREDDARSRVDCDRGGVQGCVCRWLPGRDRGFLVDDFLQPLRRVVESECSRKGARCAVTGSVPGDEVELVGEARRLRCEKPVIGCQPG